ncbi:hypothetical protein PMAYCL1PPCAC_24081, partial [Pristionchus mayeri]
SPPSPSSSAAPTTHSPSTTSTQTTRRGEKKERSTTKGMERETFDGVNTSPPSTSLPSTERTHHHSPRAITFAPLTDRPITHTPLSTKWTTATPSIDSFPTNIPSIVVPSASRFFVSSTTRLPSPPSTVFHTKSTTPFFSTVFHTERTTSASTLLTEKATPSPSTVTSTSPSSIPTSSISWTEPHSSPSSPSLSSSTSAPSPSSPPPPPTLLPSLPEDFLFEPIATTTDESSRRETEAELPSREEESSPSPPHAVVPRVRVSVDAASLVNEEGDKEGPLGVSMMRKKKTIKPFAASSTSTPITPNPLKRCCPCCAERLEESPSSTARPVRHSVTPSLVFHSTTFPPIAHTNPPQYVVNFYDQQQIPLSRPPPPSYIPQPPPPLYLPPSPPPPPP